MGVLPIEADMSQPIANTTTANVAYASPIHAHRIGVRVRSIIRPCQRAHIYPDRCFLERRAGRNILEWSEALWNAAGDRIRPSYIYCMGELRKWLIRTLEKCLAPCHGIVNLILLCNINYTSMKNISYLNLYCLCVCCIFDETMIWCVFVCKVFLPLPPLKVTKN